MTNIGSLGVWTAALDALEVPAAREQVAALDSQGWGALWVPEAYGREALTASAVYLAACERMAVATGIASIWARDAVSANAGARTLEAAFPGRFVLGLGVSHAPLVERLRGHVYDKPLSAMREYLEAMDASPYAAAGGSDPPPRVLAALGPRMQELSREHTQGVHSYLVTPEATAATSAVLGSDKILAVEQAVVLDDDDAEWRERANWHLEIYTGLPSYRASWSRQGFDEADLVRGGSDRLKSAMVVRGLDAIRGRVQEHMDAGATHVCLQVLDESPFHVPSQDWARLAEALL